MKKYLLFLLIFLFALHSFGQKDSIYSELQITSITYKGETLKLNTPKVFVQRNFGNSEITSLGFINGHEIGLQVEILRSNLGNVFSSVRGDGYFIKNDGEWKLKGKFYHPCEVRVISEIPSFNERDFENGGAEVRANDEGIGIHYLYRFYIIR